MPRCHVWRKRASCALTSTTLSVIAWTVRGSAAAPSDQIREAIRQGLPRYDAKIHANHLAAQNAATVSVPQEAEDDSINLDADKATIALPRMIVRSTKEETATPAVTLPRIVVRPSLNNVKIEELLTPAARDAALVKKHLSSFDRNFLNRFTLPWFGRSRESRARNAEAVEAAASQLNAIADLIERESGEDADSEEQKKLKKLYLEAYISRPK